MRLTDASGPLSATPNQLLHARLNTSQDRSTLLGVVRAHALTRGGLVMIRIVRLAFCSSIAIFVGALSASAQNSVQQPAPGSLIARPVNLVGGDQGMSRLCPVSLRALHAADGGIRNVDKSKPQGVAQLLHLILTSKDSREIVEARLRVRGVSPHARVSHADAPVDDAKATRFVSVRLKPGDDHDAVGKAWVPGLSAVLEVELNAITFSDGASQRFTASEGCR